MTPSTSENNLDTVAIHQPNYIPWSGYFYKMSQCDIFVYLDAVQYPRGQSFANRNKVKTPNGTTWLTIPISVPSGQKGKATYREVSFANDKFVKKHLKTLKMSYKKASHFEEIYPILEQSLREHDDFAELTIDLNNKIAHYLGINTRCVLLSDLLENFGDKTNLIIDICKELGVNTYLSGTGGGKEYNDEQKLNQADITLTYSDFNHPQYPQLWGEFESHLSVIDLMFNCGPESSSFLGIS